MDSVELFECPRHAGNLRLTKIACSDMWQRGRRCTDPSLTEHICRGCVVGARNAGVDLPDPPTEKPAPRLQICPRCTKPASRIVKGICVSCYNRALEWRKGRNAKGTAPVGKMELVSVSVHLEWPDRRDVVVSGVVSELEARLRLARQEGPGLAFARSVPVTISPQLSLFGGLR